ncbi:hypothetical protein [Streptomyces sp. NPDC058664]|uniref:hypothetical protein n=1 Tax=unclassified Streptomyces TaxID=2593676 RepID=UPI0036580899
MSHATVTLSARITEAAPARPLLVVGYLDRAFGSAALFTLCAAQGVAAFTLCAAQDTAAFTLCAGPPPANSAPTTAPTAVEGDVVAGAWI